MSDYYDILLCMNDITWKSFKEKLNELPENTRHHIEEVLSTGEIFTKNGEILIKICELDSYSPVLKFFDDIPMCNIWEDSEDSQKWRLKDFWYGKIGDDVGDVTTYGYLWDAFDPCTVQEFSYDLQRACRREWKSLNKEQ